MSIERLIAALFYFGITFGALALGTLMVWFAGRPDPTRIKVRAVVVDFEQRYDPSYKIMEDYPVVEYVLGGRATRSVLVAGYWKSGHRPMIKKGGAIDVYVDPMSSHEVVARTRVGPLLLVGLALGVVVAAIGASC